MPIDYERDDVHRRIVGRLGHRIHPKLVAQIAFIKWTVNDKLRQPAFLGLRFDKKPSECTWSARER